MTILEKARLILDPNMVKLPNQRQIQTRGWCDAIEHDALGRFLETRL